jgi:hypothetical protein
MIKPWMEAVCAKAGWSVPGIDSSDRYRFRLDGGMIIDASSPDHRTLVLQAEIKKFSQADRDQTIKRAATAVLPRTFTDTATLSLDMEKKSLRLHRVVLLGTLRASEFSDVMENFVNDLAFYKAL